ncbi:MAG: hypothetical protein Q9225_005619 [Loekoesia sp. 1 TL-2023]
MAPDTTRRSRQDPIESDVDNSPQEERGWGATSWQLELDKSIDAIRSNMGRTKIQRGTNHGNQANNQVVFRLSTTPAPIRSVEARTEDQSHGSESVAQDEGISKPKVSATASISPTYSDSPKAHTADRPHGSGSIAKDEGISKPKQSLESGARLSPDSSVGK